MHSITLLKLFLDSQGTFWRIPIEKNIKMEKKFFFVFFAPLAALWPPLTMWARGQNQEIWPETPKCMTLRIIYACKIWGDLVQQSLLGWSSVSKKFLSRYDPREVPIPTQKT